jgi:hypothetical protein
MKVVKSGLGLFVGLVCYAALGWMLNETALGHQIVGAIALLWLLIAFAGSALLVIAGLCWFLSKQRNRA